ncbi:hypothetical protein [Azospirillum argentinense]
MAPDEGGRAGQQRRRSSLRPGPRVLGQLEKFVEIMKQQKLHVRNVVSGTINPLNV